MIFGGKWILSFKENRTNIRRYPVREIFPTLLQWVLASVTAYNALYVVPDLDKAPCCAGWVVFHKQVLVLGDQGFVCM